MPSVDHPFYEAILIAHPDLNETKVSHLTSQFSEIVAKQGGKVLETISLGKRRLSYRIKKVSEALFLQVHLQIPAEALTSLTKAAGLMEEVLRIMIVAKSKRRAHGQSQQSVSDR